MAAVSLRWSQRRVFHSFPEGGLSMAVSSRKQAVRPLPAGRSRPGTRHAVLVASGDLREGANQVCLSLIHI